MVHGNKKKGFSSLGALYALGNSIIYLTIASPLPYKETISIEHVDALVSFVSEFESMSPLYPFSSSLSLLPHLLLHSSSQPHHELCSILSSQDPLHACLKFKDHDPWKYLPQNYN